MRRGPGATPTTTAAGWRLINFPAMAATPATRSAFACRGANRAPSGRRCIPRSPKAEETGRLELRPNCMVLQVQHNGQGRVTGVLYVDKHGNQHVQKGRMVAVACNSIESPRLLLNSASSQFPDGLANSSGCVGKYHMIHINAQVYASFDKPVNAQRGRTAPAASRTRPASIPRAASSAATSCCRWAGLGLGCPGCPSSWASAPRRGPRLRLVHGRLRFHRRGLCDRRGHAARRLTTGSR